MALFEKLDTKAVEKDVAKPAGTRIKTSGMYPVTIKNLILEMNKNNGRQFTMYVDYNGTAQPLYGAFALEKFDGSPLESGQKLFNRLRSIADNPDLNDTVEVELPLGKAKAKVKCNTLEEFEGMELIIQVKQRYYRKKDGAIDSNLTVIDVFTTDKASAAEYLSGENIGKQYEYREATADKVEYGNVSESEVQAWKDSFKTNNTSNTAAPSAPAAPESSAPTMSFGPRH